MEEKKIVRVRKQQTRKVLIHNDLEAAAFYFKTKIQAMQEADNRDGIAFECMACMTMLAFTWEAYLNFFGKELLRDWWHERQQLNKKMDQVYQRLKITPDWSRAPYGSLRVLNKLRNILAHGQPIEQHIDVIVEGPPGTAENRRIDLSASWEKLCTPEIALRACTDLDTIWRQLFEASGIGFSETMTHGEGSITFIENVP